MLQESKIAWQPFSPESVQRAQSEGKTVMVDFSANWCPNCKSNLKFAIETDAVRNLIATNGVVPMLADWTDPSPTIKKALNDLGYNSIPQLAIWPGQATKNSPDKKVIVRSDLLVESQVLDALKEAGPSLPPQ
jgi:thiol:disulfide interchange protein